MFKEDVNKNTASKDESLSHFFTVSIHCPDDK